MYNYKFPSFAIISNETEKIFLSFNITTFGQPESKSPSFPIKSKIGNFSNIFLIKHVRNMLKALYKAS